jgi:hypothetical protein
MKCLGKASWGFCCAVIRSLMEVLIGSSAAVGLFFVRVNQVLVRLWTRVIDADPLDWLWSRRSADLSDREWLLARAPPQRSAARVQRRVKEIVGWLIQDLCEQAMGLASGMILLCAECIKHRPRIIR